MDNPTAERRSPRSPMRPNIQISHQLNGRVKDYAAANDLDLPDAYKQIIERGLEELESREEDG